MHVVLLGCLLYVSLLACLFACAHCGLHCRPGFKISYKSMVRYSPCSEIFQGCHIFVRLFKPQFSAVISLPCKIFLFGFVFVPCSGLTMLFLHFILFIRRMGNTCCVERKETNPCLGGCVLKSVHE